MPDFVDGESVGEIAEKFPQWGRASREDECTDIPSCILGDVLNSCHSLIERSVMTIVHGDIIRGSRFELRNLRYPFWRALQYCKRQKGTTARIDIAKACSDVCPFFTTSTNVARLVPTAHP